MRRDESIARVDGWTPVDVHGRPLPDGWPDPIGPAAHIGPAGEFVAPAEQWELRSDAIVAGEDGVDRLDQIGVAIGVEGEARRGSSHSPDRDRCRSRRSCARGSASVRA